MDLMTILAFVCYRIRTILANRSQVIMHACVSKVHARQICVPDLIADCNVDLNNLNIP